MRLLLLLVNKRYASVELKQLWCIVKIRNSLPRTSTVQIYFWAAPFEQTHHSLVQCACAHSACGKWRRFKRASSIRKFWIQRQILCMSRPWLLIDKRVRNLKTYSAKEERCSIEHSTPAKVNIAELQTFFSLSLQNESSASRIGQGFRLSRGVPLSVAFAGRK